MNFMNDKNQMDRDLLIERLINQELSDSQRTELLNAVENWDDGWRNIALAFVENQVLSQALEGIDRDATSEEIRASGEKVAAASALDAGNNRSSRFGNNLWLTAASVLVSLVAGLWFGNWISSQFDSERVIAESIDNNAL